MLVKSNERYKRSGSPPTTVNQESLVERDHLELHELMASLARQKWLVIWPVIFALIALTIYFSVAPRYYSATAQILIDVQKPRIITLEAVVPSLDTTRGMIGPVIDSQVEIIRSTRIAERVIKKVNLLEDPEYTPRTTILGTIRNAISSFLSSASPEETMADGHKADEQIPSSLVDAFLAKLDVRRKGLTLILFVDFTDKRPGRAAEIANAVVEAYLEDQGELKLSSARRVNDLLQARVAELREQVLTAERRLQSYREANNLISIEGRTVGEQEITETIRQLTDSRALASSKLAELRQIEQLSKNSTSFNSISKVLNSGTIRDLRLQQTTIMRTLANTASRFGEHDSRLESSQAELENLKKEIESEVARIIQNARLDYEVAGAQVKFLEANLEALKQKSVRSNRLSIELAELERDAKSTRDLYLSLLTRLKETLVQESLLYPDARIVERAVTPRVPSSPKKFITLALALAGSLGFGVTVALMKDHLSSVIRSPREIEQILGNIPTTPVPTMLQRSRNLDTIAVSKPDSLFAQSIFSINRAIWPRPQKPGARRIVAVTSALDGEGKSVVAANLANYSAMLNTKTLLIDCNFRNSSRFAHKTDGEDTPTLADVLQGNATANDAIEQIGESGVFVCRAPKQGTVSHPMELLSSKQMQDLLKSLRRKYRLIVLDTSALLPSVDARALIDFADCCIFVVETNQTTSEEILQAHRVTSGLAGKISVVVMNKSDTGY